MLFCAPLSYGKKEFGMIQSSQDLWQYLASLPPNSIIFLDIDDTIITPISKTFRKPPYNQLIDEIKNNKDSYPNYETLVSHWRLQRKTMLVDPAWPQTLAQLKQSYRVYGLSKIDSGTFGAIASMELWRHQELKALGIEFSEAPSTPDSIQDTSFYKGLLITGKNSKSQTLAYYLPYLKAKTFVVVDDKEENLEDIRLWCNAQDIGFVGILFKGLEALETNVDPHIALLQKRYLIDHVQWLEDDEAQRVLDSQM